MEFQNVFLLNQSDVLLEHFDDEIVAINLKNGCYYSINRPGITIWKMLADKISPQHIMAEYSRVFPVHSSGLEQSIARFISELASEGLVIDSGEKADDSGAPKDYLKEIRMNNIPSGEIPVLEKYIDQQELLLLDPIHEVSNLGWPDKKEKKPDND